MRTVWLLVMFTILVQGGIGNMVIRTNTSEVLQSLLYNHVTSEIFETTPLDDFSAVVDESSIVHLSHLQLTLSLDPHTIHIDPDVNSSTISFSCAGGFVNVIGKFKLRNSTTFLSKGTLNVSLTGLDVSGSADLLLDDKCIAVRDCDIKYESHGADAKFFHKNENGVTEMGDLSTSTFLTSFKELVYDELLQMIKRRVLDNLNSALCSVPIHTLLGGEEEERSYRQIALVPIPDFNEIIDTILENLKPVIHKQGFDILHLPDINTTFTAKESVFKLHGMVLAENGSLGNLSSVHRTSDCMLAGNGSYFVASGGFGLDEFNVSYDYIDATIEHIEFTGKISVSFKVASIYFRANMAVINSTCYPSLTYIHVNKLDKIHIEVEGHKSLIVKELILLAFERYKNKLVAEADSLLRKLAEENLKNFDCSSYFGISSSFFKPNPRNLDD